MKLKCDEIPCPSNRSGGLALLGMTSLLWCMLLTTSSFVVSLNLFCLISSSATYTKGGIIRIKTERKSSLYFKFILTDQNTAPSSMQTKNMNRLLPLHLPLLNPTAVDSCSSERRCFRVWELVLRPDEHRTYRPSYRAANPSGGCFP